jgi:DNA mismatch repair protein MutS
MTSARTTPFSLLFGPDRPAGVDDVAETDAVRDLHLNRIFEAACGPGDPFRLLSLCRYLPRDEALIAQRQAVFEDLDRPDIYEAVASFGRAMSVVYDLLAPRRPRPVAAQGLRLQIAAAEAYCAAVNALAAEMQEAQPCSSLLRTLQRFLTGLIRSRTFDELESATGELQHRLRSLRFVVHLVGSRITVGTFDDEPNYETEIVDLFASFRLESAGEDGALGTLADPSKRPAGDRSADGVTSGRSVPRRLLRPRPSTDPVRERIVDLVANLHRELFADLAAYAKRHADFIDPTVALAHREAHFYLGFHNLMEKVRSCGYPTTMPVLRARPGLQAEGVFDLALAIRAFAAEPETSRKAQPEDGHTRDTTERPNQVVQNSVILGPDERLIVITGPNQGGKTTFSRVIGQLHHLAGLGCIVPGSRVELQPAADIMTQFERAEQGHQVGKLEDDLLRIKPVLEGASARSVVVLNEIFSSTASSDAVKLGRFVMGELRDRGALCVYVTFLDELSTFDPQTVSLVAQVDPADPARRTFVIDRTAANGRAYADAVAAAHGLDPATLGETLGGAPQSARADAPTGAATDVQQDASPGAASRGQVA